MTRHIGPKTQQGDMWDVLFTSIVVLLAMRMTIDAFQKCRRNRKALFMSSAVAAAAAAPVLLVDWISGFSLLLLSAILRFVAARMLSRSA
ncbi:MAG: hypothetical protein PVJ32_07860 [Anaerolineales bacterium]